MSDPVRDACAALARAVKRGDAPEVIDTYRAAVASATRIERFRKTLAALTPAEVEMCRRLLPPPDTRKGK